MTDAFGAIRQFEGFRKNAYWDVNAYRVGYGSDTYMTPDGRVHKVTRDTVINRDQAEADLARRVPEFQGVVSRQIGPQAWAGLSDGAKAALSSVAYNYGSLPGSVVRAVKSGDVNSLARAVGGLSANPGRRRQEASFILGGHPTTQPQRNAANPYGTTTSAPSERGRPAPPQRATAPLAPKTPATQGQGLLARLGVRDGGYLIPRGEGKLGDLAGLASLAGAGQRKEPEPVPTVQTPEPELLDVPNILQNLGYL